MSFQVLYCACLIFVKSSICVALIRLVASRRMLYVLYGILALSASYGFIAMMTVLLQCRPLRATWEPEAGTCASQEVIVNISYFVTACSIATDFACSIMPYVILWNLQMRRSLKFTVAAMLSLGFLYVHSIAQNHTHLTRTSQSQRRYHRPHPLPKSVLRRRRTRLQSRKHNPMVNNRDRHRNNRRQHTQPQASRPHNPLLPLLRAPLFKQKIHKSSRRRLSVFCVEIYWGRCTWP